MIRPTFLTILCTLTFVGSGYGLFNAISSYNNAEMAVGMSHDVMDEAMDQIEDQTNNEKDAQMIEKIMTAVTDGLTVENIRNINIANGISCIFTLLGAVLMWGLDKKGFWLYLIGTAISIIAPIMIYKGLLGALAGGGVAFIGILFCVLYGINLKHMR